MHTIQALSSTKQTHFGALAKAMDFAPAFVILAALIGLASVLLLRKRPAPRGA